MLITSYKIQCITSLHRPSFVLHFMSNSYPMSDYTCKTANRRLVLFVTSLWIVLVWGKEVRELQCCFTYTLYNFIKELCLCGLPKFDKLPKTVRFAEQLVVYPTSESRIPYILNRLALFLKALPFLTRPFINFYHFSGK